MIFHNVTKMKDDAAVYEIGPIAEKLLYFILQ